MTTKGGASRAVGERRLESFEFRDARTDFPHGRQIEFEMTDRFPGGADIRLLAQHDLIDQLCSDPVPRRQPRQLDAGQIALQALDQRHEIPDRKNMRLHKTPQPLNITYGCEYGMIDHAIAQQIYRIFLVHLKHQRLYHFALSYRFQVLQECVLPKMGM